MRLLVLLTASFPFDGGEEFLESELRYARGFDRILVCPCGLKETGVRTRQLPEGAECAPVRRVPAGRAEYLRLLAAPCVRRELSELLRGGRLSAARAHELLFFMKNAESIFRALRRNETVLSADEVTVYSYWFYDAAAAGALLADFLRSRGKKAEFVSRAHGFDVHEERAEHGYLPMRGFLLKSARAIFPCSEEGAALLKSRFPQYADKIRTAHLGTPDRGFRGGSREEFHLVSCSYMVPVKRLQLVAQALMEADFPVRWTHIGSGPQEAELRALAKKLPPRVTAEFPGAMRNADVLEYYRTHGVSVFVNVSSSEGVPVSIMEACSFGFPVVATGVGGTGEIVADGENGFLLKRDFAPAELLELLRRVRAMDESRYGRLCERSRAVWERSFSAERNYPEFYKELGR